MEQERGMGDVYSKWTNTCQFDKPDLSRMTCQHIDLPWLTAWKANPATWNTRPVCNSDANSMWERWQGPLKKQLHQCQKKSISWDIMVWNVCYLCSKTGRHRGRSQLRLLPSSADRQVFKFITVCSSQNAINKEAETLLTCDRDGCGACNKWPIRRHIYWPATNPGVLRIWHIRYWKSTEGNGKQILKFNDLHYMFFL